MVLNEVSCGGLVFDARFPQVVSYVIDLIKIAVPILLIIFCMFDLGKIVVSSKEEDIKKAKNLIFKRLFSAVLVFLVVGITEILVNTVGGNSKDSVSSCLQCFVNNNCSIVNENNSTGE